jgi:3',5'-cyclic AMP phosphodiesterase CpdA
LTGPGGYVNLCRMRRREFIRCAAKAGLALAGARIATEWFLPLAGAKGLQEFSFAHITDLHLDVQGTSTWQHREKSVPLFIDALRQIGRLPRLAFLVFGGDQVHAGPHDRDSLSVFQQWTRQLAVPYYILLGNTEVSPVPGRSKLSKNDYLLAWAGRGPRPERTSWAFDPVPGVRVIGFDVTVEGMPYGEAGHERRQWLENELSASRSRKLVIVITHQLLHPTTQGDLAPEGACWMTRDHKDVRALLERFPNVRLAIAGHHHATKIDRLNGIAYVADPAIVTYPCAFRVFTVTPGGILVRSIGLDDSANISRARDLLVADSYARLYDPNRPENVLAYSAGLSADDRETTIAF